MKKKKRPTAWILAVILFLLSFAGCGNPDGFRSESGAISFYYTAKDMEELKDIETVIIPEQRTIDVLSLWDFMDIYFSGPESDNLTSPFPVGTHVIGIQYSGNVLTLTLSGAYFTMMVIEMSLANCCLANTVCSYTGRKELIILDETDSIHMEINPEQFVLLDDAQEEINESFTVYFSDESHRYLISETRDATLSHNETEAAYLMRRLTEGPRNDNLVSIMPEGAEVLGMEISEGLCTLNLSNEFMEQRADDPYINYMTIYGIVNTLTGLDEINSVQFLINGTSQESYGLFPLDQPISRNTDCIGPVRTASGEVDVNIYVRNTLGESFAVPCRVKQTVSQPLAEAVTEKALNYEPPLGFDNPIPYGTELLNISVSGNTCYVDLSEKFIPQEDTLESERNAVWALVRTLTDLDDISSVVLTIGGESTGLQYVDLAEPLRSESVIFY